MMYAGSMVQRWFFFVFGYIDVCLWQWYGTNRNKISNEDKIIIGLWHGYDYKSKTDTAVPNGVDFSRT